MPAWLYAVLPKWIAALLGFFAGKSSQAATDAGATTDADLHHEEQRNVVDNQVDSGGDNAVVDSGVQHWSRPDC